MCGNRSTASKSEFYTSETKDIINNLFYGLSDVDISTLITFKSLVGVDNFGNKFHELHIKHANQMFEGYYDASGNPTVDVYGSLADASLL